MYIRIHARIYIYIYIIICIYTYTYEYVSNLYRHVYEPLSTWDARRSSGTCTSCQLPTSRKFLCRHFCSLWWWYDDPYWHTHPELPLLLMRKEDLTLCFESPRMIKHVGYNSPTIYDIWVSKLIFPMNTNQWEFQDPKMEVLYHIFGHTLGVDPLT